MNTRENTKLRIGYTIIFGCVAVILFYYLIGQIQHRIATIQIQKEMKEICTYAQNNYQFAGQQCNYIDMSFRSVQTEDVILLAEIARKDPEFEISDQYLKSLNLDQFFFNIVILDRKGKVLATMEDDQNLWKPTDEAIETLNQVFTSGYASRFPASVESKKDSYLDAIEKGNYSLMSDGASYWYVDAIDDAHAIAIKTADLTKISFSQISSAWVRLLQNETVGENGFVFAWSDQDGRILYYPRQSIIEEPLETIGLSPEKMKDQSFSWQKIDGERMYVYSFHFPDHQAWIACAVSENELEDTKGFTRNAVGFSFALLCGALVYYVILLLHQKKAKVLTDFTHSGTTTAHKSRKYKLLILTCLLVVLLFLFLIYLQTLYLMSTWAETASRHTGEIEENVELQSIYADGFVSVYDEQKQKQLGILADFLSRCPDAASASTLDAFSFAVQADQIQVLDLEGKSVSETTSMSYSSLQESVSAETTVSPAEAVAAQDVGRKTFDWMKDGRRVLLPLHDESETNSGFLYVKYYEISVDMALDTFTLSATLERIQPGKGGFVFAVDMETKKFICYPGGDLAGRDAMEYGLTENQIKDNFCDYIQINGATYYAATDVIGTNLIFYAVPKGNLLQSRIQFGIVSAACAAVLFLLIGLGLYTSREQIELVKPDNERHVIDEGKGLPEYKVLRVLGLYLILGAALFTGYSSLRESSDMGGVLGYVLSGRWERSFNVFALTSAVLILCRGGLVLFFASRFVRALGGILPLRGGTILKMVGGLVTYLAVAFLIYQCALCFGLNPTALVASAGIVSVVIGIGANSLVGDILAGIFLLMEGNIQVGDVVKVGDFRGYVMEMGLRMTKLFDIETDDVKIIPNNEVRNVIHMTMRTSIVYSEFQICYEERIEQVEKIVREELRNAKKSPLILSGPVYIGVSALGDNGVTMKMATKCHESSRKKVEREVNHIVYTIFQKNGISVPYPQVTLHTGSDEMIERE